MKKFKTELNGLEYTISATTALNAAKQTLAKQGMYPRDVYTVNGKHFIFQEKVGFHKVENSVSVEEIPESKNPAAVALGKLGGAKRTPAKAEASRINGKKGGRPRKVVEA